MLRFWQCLVGNNKGAIYVNSQYLKYDSPLGSRYLSKEMLELFSSFKRIRTWRLLWLYLARGEKSLGKLSAEYILSTIKLST
ncbi:Adenylosuccinate lyase, partial [Brachionus plicatilis]